MGGEHAGSARQHKGGEQDARNSPPRCTNTPARSSYPHLDGKKTRERPYAGWVPADPPVQPDNKPNQKPSNSGGSGSKRPVGNTSGDGTAVVAANPVISAAQNVMGQKSVRSDTTMNFTLKRGSAYCFKMTVVNGSSAMPNFTVGNGSVLKTQYVTKIGNDYYYRVWAIGAPGQSTGVYTTMQGENAQQHCVVTIG
ncbi:hypothetical protein [Anaeromassilibacillus senegalensis]|uniref:hypothetical protein n=1 Tax=Anaeromassilibacillus senegalensis TaxID=1673717 RepID=UPI0006813E21|nr:hypothetical protein [Anaeromassilibacillus senegalensis]